MANHYEVLEHSHGYTSTIYRLPGAPPRVCKAFNSECIGTHFPVEREVYERFTAAGPTCPAGILQYHGVHPTIPAGLVLEHAQNLNVWDYMWERKRTGQGRVGAEVLWKWAAQMAGALEFAHGLGALHADIHPVNVFLDEQENLKVGDWAGAVLDGGGKSHSSYRLRHRLFDADGTDLAREGISVKTEIFAFGSALFFLGMGEEVWNELREPEDKREIQRRLVAREWPDVGGMAALGNIVLGCWNIEYESMREVLGAIEVDRQKAAEN